MSAGVRAGMVEDRVPLPPPPLRHRVGGIDDYEDVGSRVRHDIMDLLGSEWSFEGRRALDFGCGAGRVLRHFLAETQVGEFHGCDIDAESIGWLREQLSPPLHVLVNGEAPPLDRPDGCFDLIWAASVFTHITDHWSAWLLELHRVLKEDGLLIATFLGPGMCEPLDQDEWDPDRIGMNVLRYAQAWELGGPLVFLSPWWIGEHWGRAFEILELREAGFGRPDDRTAGHGVVLLRRKAERPTQEELERIDPQEEREIAALRYNIRQVHAESQTFYDQWQSALREQGDNGERHAERAHLRRALETLQTSRSWRITRPLRDAADIARRLRSRPALPRRWRPASLAGRGESATSAMPPAAPAPPRDRSFPERGPEDDQSERRWG